MPGLRVIRPADANETAQAWRLAVDGEGPTALVLSRQALPVLEATAERAAEGVARGGYVLVDPPGARPDVVLVGTGSEVHLCVEAAELLAARDVSAAGWSRCRAGSCSRSRTRTTGGGAALRVPRLAVEAGSSFGWDRYADATVSIDHFGASAPGTEVLRRLGFTGPRTSLGGRRPARRLTWGHAATEVNDMRDP